MLVEFSMDTQRLQSKFEYLKIPPSSTRELLPPKNGPTMTMKSSFTMSPLNIGPDSDALKNISLKLNVGQGLRLWV